MKQLIIRTLPVEQDMPLGAEKDMLGILSDLAHLNGMNSDPEVGMVNEDLIGEFWGDLAGDYISWDKELDNGIIRFYQNQTAYFEVKQVEVQW